MRVVPLLAALAAALLPVRAAAEPPSLVALPVKIISQSEAPAAAQVSAAPAATAEAPATASQPADASEARAPVVVARPKPPALVARINLGTQRLELSVNGRPEASWAISSGRAEFPTPRGVFRPQWASKMWFSKKYDNAPMPHAVFFNGGVAVHATQSTGLLGQPASHGCVRLAPAHASRFYALVHAHGFHNTRIEVFGSPPASRIARRNGLAPVRMAASNAGARVSNGWGGWSQPIASQPFGIAKPVSLTRSANGLVHLPPGSPLKGRASFVHNGVTYVRVR